MRKKLVRGVNRRLRALPSRVANRLTEARPVAAIRERRYRSILRRHRALLPALDVARSEIVGALRKHGVAQADLLTLKFSGSRTMLEAANELMARWAPSFHEQAAAGVDFLMVPAAELATRPEIYRFGLDPDLLKLVEAYIGLPVAYDGVTLQYTVADGREASTRVWHRDREDRRMVKLAIYLTDVDDGAGPFQLLPPSPLVEPKRGGKNRFYLSERESADLAEGRFVQPISCEGAAGTAVFADTAGYFHRGKPATGSDRAALFFSYFARTPQRPFFCERSGLTRRQIGALVEDLSSAQRAAALWQKTLPLRWRLIPPAKL